MTAPRTSPSIGNEYAQSHPERSTLKLGSCPALRGVSCLACTGRNLWDSVGGNALFMNGYVRWCNLSRNEVRYPGDSAFAAVGRTAKFDATGGDYPQVRPW